MRLTTETICLYELLLLISVLLSPYIIFKLQLTLPFVWQVIKNMSSQFWDAFDACLTTLSLRCDPTNDDSRRWKVDQLVSWHFTVASSSSSQRVIIFQWSRRQQVIVSLSSTHHRAASAPHSTDSQLTNFLLSVESDLRHMNGFQWKSILPDPQLIFLSDA